MVPLLSLQGISFAYPDSGKEIFTDLEFSLYEKQRIGLMGPNGCGKTTFLRLCVGLLRPSRGYVKFKGKLVKSDKDLIRLRRSIGFVFQNPDDQLFSPTVLEDVAFGPLNLGMDRDRAEEIARWSLAMVGLDGFEDRIIHKLSGGEKRLLSIATILAMQPEAMLLDEPSTGLDVRTRRRIIELLNRLDMALVVVSHDGDFVLRTTSSYCTIEGGRIIALERDLIHQHVHYHPAGHIPHEHI